MTGGVVAGALEAHLRARRDLGHKLLVPYVTGGLRDDWVDVLGAMARDQLGYPLRVGSHGEAGDVPGTKQRLDRPDEAETPIGLERLREPHDLGNRREVGHENPAGT